MASSPPSFPVGASVLLRGLVKGARLNGSRGVVKSPPDQSSGHQGVYVHDEGKSLSIRPVNLEYEPLELDSLCFPELKGVLVAYAATHEDFPLWQGGRDRDLPRRLMEAAWDHSGMGEDRLRRLVEEKVTKDPAVLAELLARYNASNASPFGVSQLRQKADRMAVSTDNSTNATDAGTSTGTMPGCCAACGKCGDEDTELKTCAACKMVKYCSVQCQRAHRPSHATQCKKRAAELFDEKLFEDLPPNEDCPVCFLPLPINDSEITYRACCGKRLCNGCVYGVAREIGEVDDDGLLLIGAAVGGAILTCPFCRTLDPLDDGELLEMLNKRVEVNDPHAISALGHFYYRGSCGLPQDSDKAIELFLKGAELGSKASCFRLGTAYFGDWGGEKDMKKATKYFQLAAVSGCVGARGYLCTIEIERGNRGRALKHGMIAARAGCNLALDCGIKPWYKEGLISKDEFAKTLRAHKRSVDAMKSDQRDVALSLKKM